MKEEMTKVKLTIPIPFDRQDRNGNVFTKESIESAVNSFRNGIPIVYNSKEGNTKAIGVVNNSPSIVSWDFENQVCTVAVDGTVFCSGAELIVNKIEDNKITDFEITSIELTI